MWSETLRYAQGDTAWSSVILSGAKNLSADVGKKVRARLEQSEGMRRAISESRD
jgi:hypothetical protein